MTLGQKFSQFMIEFIRDNSFMIVIFFCIVLFVFDYYNRFLRVIKRTDHIDLVERYVWLRLYRRYKRDNF